MSSGGRSFRALRPDDEDLAAVWDALEVPEPPPVPPGFAGRVVSHCRQRAGSPSSPWMLAAAAISLVCGLWLGLSLERPAPRFPSTLLDPRARSEIPSARPEIGFWSPAGERGVPSLAELFWATEGADWNESDARTETAR